MPYGFSFNAARCSGCMACVVACMDQNNISENDRSFRDVIKLEQGTYPNAKISFVSLSCFHCTNAPCIKACPSKAIVKNEENGSIEVDSDKCIGCHVCAMVCPFGAPRFSQKGDMQKCHLCIDRVEQQKEPACVHTCTTRALGFGTLEQLSKQKAENASLKIITSFLTETI